MRRQWSAIKTSMTQTWWPREGGSLDTWQPRESPAYQVDDENERKQDGARQVPPVRHIVLNNGHHPPSNSAPRRGSWPFIYPRGRSISGKLHSGQSGKGGPFDAHKSGRRRHRRPEPPSLFRPALSGHWLDASRNGVRVLAGVGPCYRPSYLG